MEGPVGGTGAHVQGGATLDARIPTPCQGEGRGFESRRPLQRKSRSGMCEGLKSAPRGASRGTAHHICTTFAKLFSPIAPGEPLFSRVRVAAPSWLGCVGPASPRRPVGRRRGRERGFRARHFGTTCCHWWSYGEGVGHKYLDRAEGIQRGTPAFGPGNFRGLEARPGCGHNPSAGSLGESRTMSSTSSSDMGGRPGPRVDRQRRHFRGASEGASLA